MENDMASSRKINMSPVSNEIESLRNYVERNKVRVAEGRKCVDGRYNEDQAAGMIARPGGDFGYVMALMTLNSEIGLGLSGKESFDRVYSAITADNGTFYMHTDHHADPEEDTEGDISFDHAPLIGCGHILKATNIDLAGEYIVDPIEVTQVVGIAREMSAAGEPVEIVNLAGEHKEKDVLVVKGIEFTVNPHDDEEMHFVYDADRDEEFMKELVFKLQHGGLPITYEQFKKVSDKHLQVTLQQLAAGKSIYEVDFNFPQPIKLAGIIDIPQAA